MPEAVPQSSKPLTQRFPLFATVLVLCLLVEGVTLICASLVNLGKVHDSGFPDSATILRVRELVQTGRLYPDMNRPPYMVTVYGPLLYVVLGAAYEIAGKLGAHVEVFMRLAVFASFCCCVALVAGIAGHLYRSTRVAWLSALFAASSEVMFDWTTQLRPDFMGSCCSLASLYIFLTVDTPGGIGAAAVCAGIALLFKQTFVALPAALVLWLLWRRWGAALLFGGVAAVTAMLCYGFVGWREPQLWIHWAALSRPIYTFRETRMLITRALTEPAVPFGVLGAFLAWRESESQKTLVIFYAAAAWAVAILTIPQVGGNVNYFCEPLFTSAILAGSALPALQWDLDRAPKLVVMSAIVLLVWPFVSRVQYDLTFLRGTYQELHGRAERRIRWQRFLSLVSGHRLLSTHPEVTLQSSIPEVSEPFLNSMLAYRGKWSFDPIAAEIESRHFDFIVLDPRATEVPPGSRGLSVWNQRMWSAIAREYQLGCVFEDQEVWVRRGTAPPPGTVNGSCLAVP